MPYKYTGIGSHSMRRQALLKGKAVPGLTTNTQRAGEHRQRDITAGRAKPFHDKK